MRRPPEACRRGSAAAQERSAGWRQREIELVEEANSRTDQSRISVDSWTPHRPTEYFEAEHSTTYQKL
jgi:hypothetical protein